MLDIAFSFFLADGLVLPGIRCAVSGDDVRPLGANFRKSYLNILLTTLSFMSKLRA